MKSQKYWIFTVSVALGTPLFAWAIATGLNSTLFHQIPTPAILTGGIDGIQLNADHYADLNNDQLADAIRIAFLDDPDQTLVLEVYIGQGNGTFSIAEVLPAGFCGEEYSGQLFTTDVNGDGFVELIFRTFGDETCGDLIYWNNQGSGFHCIGDILDDGQVGVHDLMALLEDWGCEDLAN
ncbi:MAG: FG-GAP-like repeat-containing protein [Phycisphaerales bacterium]|jgi:hypothetical protein|nr:FG-GAP-like repeat-containing protein [Phycisphaerales bacterium]